MSLKAFHLVFVTVAALLTLVMAGWAVLQFVDTRRPVYLAGVAGAVACGGMLIWYGRYFLRKLKNIGYL
jgi:hypothetical protein